MTQSKKRDFLWIVLFLIVLINGFEAGGYQASLWSIGKDFDLSMTSMGLYAAMELFATMLLLAASSSAALVMALCIPLGLASGAIYPSVLTIMLPFAGKKTATATGIITACTGIGGVVFTALTGFMADAFGMRIAMMGLVSFFAISLLSALTVIRMGNDQ